MRDFKEALPRTAR